MNSSSDFMLDLLRKFLKEDNLIKHSMTVAGIMREVASF